MEGEDEAQNTERTRSPQEDTDEVEQINKHEWLVTRSTPGNSYPVNYYADTPDIEQNRSCQCPDWEYRHPHGGCKHIRVVRIVLGSFDLDLTFVVHMDGGKDVL